MDINTCIFTGRFGNDPDYRVTQKGTSVCSFDLAVGRAKAKGAETAVTDWFSFVAWNATAEYISKYFTRGTLATITARASTRFWEDKDGKKHKEVEFVVDEIKAMGGSRKDAQPEPTSGSASFGYQTNASSSGFEELEDDGDDLPF